MDSSLNFLKKQIAEAKSREEKIENKINRLLSIKEYNEMVIKDYTDTYGEIDVNGHLDYWHDVD
jgi:archaellum component FlaC